MFHPAGTGWNRVEQPEQMATAHGNDHGAPTHPCLSLWKESGGPRAAGGGSAGRTPTARRGAANAYVTEITMMDRKVIRM